MSEKLSRTFDSEDRYEREKHTRIMPDSLRQLGLYTLRMMWPPDMRPPFGVEFLTCITNVDHREDGYYDVGFVMQPQDEPEVTDSFFNHNGFMVLPNDGHPGLVELPPEIEMAYFVGSLDPYDVEFAEMVAKATELTTA